MTFKATACAALGCVAIANAQPASAQSFPPIYTLGETDTADLRGCNMSYAAAINRANATLRDYDIPMGTEQQATSQRALALYINLNIRPISYDDGDDSGSCYGGVNVTLSSYAFVTEPVTNTRRFASLAFCDEGFTFTLDRSSLRAEVERQIEQKVVACLQAWLSSAE